MCLGIVETAQAEKDDISLEAYEDSLAGLAEIIMMDTIADNRLEAANVFKKTLKAALKKQGAFDYPFDSLKTISIQQPEDNKFRIFTWQLCHDSNTFEYFGMIQMNATKPKVYELADKSEKVRNPKHETLTTRKWYGALYYNIRPFTKRKRNKYYLVFGFDAYSYTERQKILDVLYFQNGRPKFGAPVLVTQEEGQPDEVASRYIMKYAASSAATLNFNDELNMVIYDHLIMFGSPYKEEGITMMPDGSYHGFKYKRGKWYSVEKVFTHKQEVAPVVKPTLGRGRKTNPLLGPGKN